ncbi:hypothetical protein [Allorhizobium taibaishanense]|uniref:ElaB/YqjD/DUF883 family membrane-anchored ribosome-binding protein n=1 Tax=Allorhizobium taibaishanense TaxID=887144 RepID=A0A1Q9A8H6_9HYPH|nr:hypothetical protein [Allorhizobium taibaishanense]MBB4009596.1 ElaB/YqjD/DUF883 family membrane-anchored ribosome-binding protein [Allorhizobium taibaishanense]OLP50879.1 hypothetical protein BJF91_06475 [Allorhizobium taibaishanense]
MVENMRMQAEMRELQAQVAQLKDRLAEQSYSVANQVRGSTSHALNNAARSAQDVARYAKEEASSVAGIVREHPTATSTALLGIALVGAFVGYLVATQSQPEPRRRWY